MMGSSFSDLSGVGLITVGVLLSLIATGPVQAQPAAQTVRDTVALDPSGTVEIDTYKGSVTVTTWDRAAVGYEVVIEPPYDGDDVPFTHLDVRHSEEELELDADFPWRLQLFGVITISPGGTERAPFHYTVSVPASARLEIDDYASALQVADVKGDVVIDTYSGTVEASNLGGGLDLEAYETSAQVSFSGLTAPVSLDTYSGPVDLTLPSGAGFDLETDLQSANQLTVDGSLSLPPPTEDGNYDGPVNGGGPELSIESYGSTITLRTPRN
jgi:hypothetical protein